MTERLVSEILNRFLGTYIENLDPSKLRISIWGGDAVLTDLVLKQTAFDDLDLPVRPVFGHVGCLKLKIPWKSWYNSQWVAVVEKLVIVVVPNTTITYNEEKEKQLKHDVKLATLQRLEEARQKLREEEKGPQAEGFVEKLMVQAIRNIQVTIKDIHIRYEDCITKPGSPFAAGLTLHDLSMKSTDANWKECIHQDKLIYKINSLDSLGIYWNPKATLFSQTDLSKEEIMETLQSFIASRDNRPAGMHYVIGPIRSMAKLQVNPKPETDEAKFSIPKVLLNFVMDELAIGLTRHQYSDLMALLDSMDRMRLSSMYRKYRPSVTGIKNNARHWWHYAYNCNLENIQRIHRNWSWKHIREHRARCRSYKAVYKLKLENKKLTPEQVKEIEDGERALDVFNITLMRRQAEMEVEREGALRKQEQQQQKGWFGGWFSWGGQKQDEKDAAEGSLVKKLEEAMGDEEKKNLYEAIGYSETGIPPEYPEEFEDIQLEFLLKQLVLIITDDENEGANVTKAKLNTVTLDLKRRSAADSVRVVTSVQSFVVEGFSTDGSPPELVTSEDTSKEKPLLQVLFETNPMDKSCDQRVKLEAQPLQLVYDAATFNQLRDVFAPPKNISLQQLQAAALNQLEVVKERSVTGLQAAIDNHSVLDLNIAIAASHVIVPENGVYSKDCSALVLTLGSMTMKTVPRKRDAPALTDLVTRGMSQEEVVEVVRSSSYDHFTIELVDTQAVVAMSGEDWRSTLSSKEPTPLHLLQPTTLHVDLLKCLLTDDPNLAKVKVNVSLPNVTLSIVDERLLQLAYIAHSIPQPEQPEQEEDEEEHFDQDTDLNMNVILEDAAIARLEKVKLNPDGQQQDTPQFTKLELSFSLKETSLELKRATGKTYQPLMKLSALSTSVEVVQRTFDLTASVILGGVLVQHLDGCDRWLLSTPLAEGSSEEALLTIKFTQVDPKCPEFESKHASTLQLLCVDVTNLTAQLEQTAILSIIAFAEQLSNKLGEVAPTQPTEEKAALEPLQKVGDEMLDKKTQSKPLGKLKRKSLVKGKKKDIKEITTLRVLARLGRVSVVIGLANRDVAQVEVAGLVANIMMQGKDITISSRLKDFTVIDPGSEALHPKIVEVMDAEAWDANVKVYGEATEGHNYLDMNRVNTSVALTFGCARIVFLNKFIKDVLSWINTFQSAKDAVASASVAAAAAAQARMQEAYQECSRVSLALTLRAPLILIPQDSHSLSGLMVDLGEISIRNKFVLGEDRNELGYPSIFDEMTLELYNVKVSRVVLSVTGVAEQEHGLLQPISLDISVKRNLTISWYKKKPELEIQAMLKPIKMVLSEEDLRVTLKVLQDNLGEQGDVSLSEVNVPQVDREITENAQDVEMFLAQHGHRYTKIRFTFTIESVTLSLLTSAQGTKESLLSEDESMESLTSSSFKELSPQPGTSDALALPRVSLGDTRGSRRSLPHVTGDVAMQESGSVAHGRELAEFSLKVVTLKGEMCSDGSLSANLVLFDCILQDTRPGQEGHITRMMRRKPQTGKNGMIDLTYRQGPSGDTFIDMRISGFVLLLHLPYLLRIQRFFTDNLPQKPQEPSPPPLAAPKAKDFKRQKSGISTIDMDKHTANLMTVRFRVEQPDIAIVKDVTTEDTHCIIMHAEVNGDLKTTASQQSVNASITKIQMYTCCYNPSRRKETLSQILNPCEIGLVSYSTPSHAQHLDVTISRVDLRVSPITIELLSSLTMALTALEEPVKAEVEEVKEWVDLWDPRPLDISQFDFLAVEEASEAFGVEPTEAVSPVKQGPGGELAVVAMECFLVTIETGSGTSPIPLIKFQSSVTLTASGFFSKKLNVNGDLSIELAYFNSRLAVWEPLLEPVEVVNRSAFPDHAPWSLHFEMSQEMGTNGPKSPGKSCPTSPIASPESDEVDFEELQVPLPATTISVTAKDSLHLTVTKTFMEVLTTLSKAFADAYKRNLTARDTHLAPYRIINQTGKNVSVAVRQSGFQVAAEGGENVEEVMVESGAEVDLFEIAPQTPKHKRVASLVADYQAVQDRSITFRIADLGCQCTIPVSRADKRYFQVEHTRGGEKWGLVAAISVESGCKIITLSSCVQITNHLDVTVEVYYMNERGNEVVHVVSLKPGEMASLPLHAVYTLTAELFFSVEGHSVCIIPFIWRDLQNSPDLVQELQCVPRDVDEYHSSPFFIAAIGDVEQILWQNTSRRTMTSALYKIYLKPKVVLHNLLPVPVSVEPPGTMCTNVLMPGASVQLTKAQLGMSYLNLQILNYQGCDWVCGKPLAEKPQELSVWTFESRGDIMGGPLQLDLGMMASAPGSTMTLNLYCPFWMVNKTGLMLTYRSDAPSNYVVHEEGNGEAVMFSFKSKAFFGKKKVTVKVEDSEFSEKFSLDVVGSSGSVSCKSPSRTYQVGVDIQLGNSGLTKIVVFTPFYKILNKAPFDLEVMEAEFPHAEWFTVLSGECIGWWPIGNGRRIHVRIRGTSEMTAALRYDQPLSTLLYIPNKYGGISAEVNLMDGGAMVQLDQFSEGMTPVLIINHLTNTTVSLWQHNNDNKKVHVKPQSIQHYTWSDPGGLLQLVWACGAGKITQHSLDKDERGQMNDDTVHWVVFLFGNQRCLLFTDEIEIASAALNAVESERINQELKFSLSSIDLSLVDDVRKKEVAYMSLASSGVVWEYRKIKGRKYRPFTQNQTNELEVCHNLYQAQLKTFSGGAPIQSHYVIRDNFEVDFESMKIFKPFHKNIRRTFQPGIWFELRTSPHQRQIHLKINSLQIDNQMTDVMFPVVLARVPTPRSVMAETVAKPFCEVSIVQRLTSPSFSQYKYLAMLIQEFHIKVELPFVYAVLEVLFPSNDVSDNLYSMEDFEEDNKLVRETLTMRAQSQAISGQKDYYDLLHLSPIKMHLSFSLSGSESGASLPVGGQVIHLFLESVGVTLTEVQDVVFRLSYMERQNKWMTWGQLTQEMISHYRGQFLMQLFKVVLGLDVIGNPYGLVVGLTHGVESLFYEPIQGAIEGPGEFAEGMLYGLTNFMGATVGGAAGAVSRITGTIGKGVAALTLDDDYQRRRREAMHRKPADGIESLARGGKGMVTGVFDGVTGVFLKPIEGAKKEGVEGFFKGMGKGMVGLVTRPASGVIDFASGSFDAVMRATEAGEETVSRRRPSRFIGPDNVVRPYVQHFAEGAKLLRELEKGRYAETDVYVGHAILTENRSMLIATDKRIMCITRNDILGHWKVDWLHVYEDLSEPPFITPKGLRLSVRQEKKRVLGVFGGGDNSKLVPLKDPEEGKVSFQSRGSSVNVTHSRQHGRTMHAVPPVAPTSTSPSSIHSIRSSSFTPKRSSSSLAGEQERQTQRRRGLFGVLGALSTGVVQAGRGVSQGISQLGNIGSQGRGSTPRSEVRGHVEQEFPVTPRSSEVSAPPSKEVTEDIVSYIQVPYESLEMQAFLTAVIEAYQKTNCSK